MISSFFIGWDVGAWLAKIGDALWILDDEDRTTGHWHGNLGGELQASKSVNDFVVAVFKCCGVQRPKHEHHITLAIDAPFALPAGLLALLHGTAAPEHLESALGNPYLFRDTERFAAKHLGRNPLSALQDKIGSQTTKIIHFLTKLRLKQHQPGVWQPEEQSEYFKVIEAYPAMSKLPDNLIRPGIVNDAYIKFILKDSNVSADEKDALLCALIARLHATQPGMLYHPPPERTESEGWIWFPKIDSATSDGKMDSITNS